MFKVEIRTVSTQAIVLTRYFPSLGEAITFAKANVSGGQQWDVTPSPAQGNG